MWVRFREQFITFQEPAQATPTRVVDDQQIAAPQQVRQVEKHAVRRRASGHVERPGSAALGGRMLRDQRFGQREIEIIEGGLYTP